MDEKELSANASKKEQETAGFQDSDFIPLEDLVYAPLYALARSNHQLRAQVIEAIQSMGTVRQNGQDKIVQLDNINIAYDQVRSESDGGYSVDNLQVQVPLLSIVPVTNLNVEKAEIDFSTEVRTVKGEEGNCAITARICAPDQRDSDFLPRVSYKLKICSLPATEGIMRLTDMLNTNQIAKQTDTTPVAVDGTLSSDEHKAARQEINAMKAKVKKLRQLYQKVSDMTEEQEGDRQQMPQAYPDGSNALGEGADGIDQDKYTAAQSEIEKRIREYQDQIISKELELGLERDYE